jgi:hypothetical protein
MLRLLLSRLSALAETVKSVALRVRLLECVLLAENPPALLVCLSSILGLAAADAAVEALLRRIILLLSTGGTSMACVTKHSTKVAGNGVCCAQVASGALATTAITLPTYSAGGLATNPTLPHVQVTSLTGRCGTCWIAGSKSPKHPGKPVLKYTPGGPGCPSTGTGCCALTTQ